MKKVLISMLMLIALATSLPAQITREKADEIATTCLDVEKNPPLQETLWDYPLKPEMEEWATLRTKKQMVDTCQIPFDILNKVTTEDLVAICLNYPMFNDYLLYDDERRGMRLFINRFNGLLELSKREDGARKLMNVYFNFPILTQIQNNPLSNDYHTPYKLPFLEMVLCDDLFLNKLSDEELIELKIIAVNKYVDKLQNMEVYSLFNIKKSMLLASIIIGRLDDTALTQEQKEIIKRFIKNYQHCDAELLTEISKIISL
jgi:hypothetical protein